MFFKLSGVPLRSRLNGYEPDGALRHKGRRCS